VQDRRCLLQAGAGTAGRLVEAGVQSYLERLLDGADSFMSGLHQAQPNTIEGVTHQEPRLAA
jgi:hypothetical protein